MINAAGVSNGSHEMNDTPSKARPPIAWNVMALFALLKLLLHAFTAHRYGYFRDELYYIE